MCSRGGGGVGSENGGGRDGCVLRRGDSLMPWLVWDLVCTPRGKKEKKKKLTDGWRV